jgi:uncharacterized protein (DUF1778 family)
LFQGAAALSGRTLSEFVVTSAEDSANKVIQDHAAIERSRSEQVALVTALLNPPNSARLRQHELAAPEEGHVDSIPAVLQIFIEPGQGDRPPLVQREDTVRGDGSKTDVYETFTQMLARGAGPGDIGNLLRQGSDGSPARVVPSGLAARPALSH